MIPQRLSRLLVAGALALPSFFGGTPAETAAPADRIQAARDLLASPAVRFMTPAGLMGLARLAGEEPVLGADTAIARQAGSTPVRRPVGPPQAAIGPAGLRNVRVNDPREDGQPPTQTTQSEPSIAVSDRRVVVGFNDSQRVLQPQFPAGSSLAGYAYSDNRGEDFVDGGALPDAAGCLNLSDPWLAADRAGVFYYSFLAACIPGIGGTFAGVARSTDGGKTFGPPTIITPQTPSPGFVTDKPALTVGPDPVAPARDDLYDAWNDFSLAFAGDGGGGGPKPPTGLSGLAVARSTDAGEHWSVTYAAQTPTQPPCPNPSGIGFVQYLGAQPFVDPATGVLFVASEKITVGCASGPGAPPGPTVLTQVVFVSRDGGQHFGPETKVADATFSLPAGALDLAPGRLMRNADFPTVAMLGSDLFVAWNDGRSGHSHIMLSRSDDGVHWSAPASVTSGAGDELQPAMSSSGTSLDIAYLHRNPDNTLDVDLASSSDGSTFTFRRVTDQSFPGALTDPPADPVLVTAYMGDYIANVAADGHTYLAWGDNRDVVTDFLFPQGRPDPDVFFARR